MTFIVLASLYMCASTFAFWYPNSVFMIFMCMSSSAAFVCFAISFFTFVVDGVAPVNVSSAFMSVLDNNGFSSFFVIFSSILSHFYCVFSFDCYAYFLCYF